MSELIKFRGETSFVNKLTNEADHKIVNYQVVTGKEILTLSRSLVERLYRLYTNDGKGFSARTISLDPAFDNYTVEDITKIIKTFRQVEGLTKSVVMFAPHELEEFAAEELGKIRQDFRKKQVLITDKNQELNDTKKTVEELQTIINDRDALANTLKEIVSKSTTKPYVLPTLEMSDGSLCIWLADMHIGCRVDTSGATMQENIGWNNEMVKQRLSKVLEQVKALGKLNEIWVFNLGDAIDGLDGTTTRRDVRLPQNMSNSEMMKNYIDDMVWFFDSLVVNKCASKYYFRSVGESNHGGTGEYGANLALSSILSYKGINSHVMDGPFGFTKVCGHQIVYFHGKDNTNQNKPWPVALNERTTNYLHSIVSTNGLDSCRGNILFVKADSHQSQLSATNDFEYMSVGSLFGGSAWAQANFATRSWEVNMSLFRGSLRLDTSVRDFIRGPIKPNNI